MIWIINIVICDCVGGSCLVISVVKNEKMTKKCCGENDSADTWSLLHGGKDLTSSSRILHKQVSKIYDNIIVDDVSLVDGRLY